MLLHLFLGTNTSGVSMSFSGLLLWPHALKCLCTTLHLFLYLYFFPHPYRRVSRLVRTWCPVKASVVGCFTSTVWVCHSNPTKSCFVKSAAQVRSSNFVQETAIGRLFYVASDLLLHCIHLLTQLRGHFCLNGHQRRTLYSKLTITFILNSSFLFSFLKKKKN